MASARSCRRPATTIQPSFICGRPAIFESPLIENAAQSSTPASEVTRSESGAKA
jgi:hypothetical protein